MIRLLKNFSYTILSNLGNALVSMLVVFIIPKIISPHDYGMFQIFLFYFSYAGLIQFGWLDGIYLRYGGAYYSNLDKSMVRGQFQLYTTVQTIICLVVEMGTKKNVLKVGNVDFFYTIQWISTLSAKRKNI